MRAREQLRAQIREARKLPLCDRFMLLVEKTDGCWLWKGAKNIKGYGVCRLGGNHITAHRLSYELFVGAIRPGQWVLHDCDNPRCVRPDHLHLGNNIVNVREKMERGRHKWLAPPRKLSAQQFAEIQASDLPSRKLAASYGVSPTLIKRVKRGEAAPREDQ